jgi:hypothetical protein
MGFDFTGINGGDGMDNVSVDLECNKAERSVEAMRDLMQRPKDPFHI